MSKIVFWEGIIKENDKNRPPKQSGKTYYAKNHKEGKDGVYGKSDETNNTVARGVCQ